MSNSLETPETGVYLESMGARSGRPDVEEMLSARTANLAYNSRAAHASPTIHVFIFFFFASAFRLPGSQLCRCRHQKTSQSGTPSRGVPLPWAFCFAVRGAQIRYVM